MTTFIPYYRVSTKRQGDSGLGLEAQEFAAMSFAKGHNVVGRYVEIESGRHSDRPELLKALAHCRRAHATLLVAKLDRLARNVAFLSALMEAEVPFVCVDMPTANKLTLHIMAAVAEAESLAISQRTKAALVQFKLRGGKLGAARPNGRKLSAELMAKGRVASAKVRSAQAQAARSEILPLVQELLSRGLTLAQIADELNLQCWKTTRGRPWTKGHVSLLVRPRRRRVTGIAGLASG